MSDYAQFCPHCGVLGLHTRLSPSEYRFSNDEMSPAIDEPYVFVCLSCKLFFVTVEDDTVYPQKPYGPAPNRDLPKECIDDFEEARMVFTYSPRASAALLRLVIEKMCALYGSDTKTLNENIEALKQKGLSPPAIRALHMLRVVGNEAVHPGTLDIGDNKEIALRLFNAVNYIANVMISMPKEIEGMISALPDGVKRRIEK